MNYTITKRQILTYVEFHKSSRGHLENLFPDAFIFKPEFFAVRSKSKDVYDAFIATAKSYGIDYNDKFSSRDAFEKGYNKELGFSNHWNGNPCVLSCSFTNADRGVIDLDTDYKTALLTIKNLAEQHL